MLYKGEPSLKNVLDALKANIMRVLHCGSIGIITEIKQSTIMCKLLPTSKGCTNNIVECYYVEPFTPYQVGDEVIILFMDDDFRTNQKQLDNNMNLSELLETSEKHSSSYGIIICKKRQSLPEDSENVASLALQLRDNELSLEATLNNDNIIESNKLTLFNMPIIALGSYQYTYNNSTQEITTDYPIRFDIKLVAGTILAGDEVQLVRLKTCKENNQARHQRRRRRYRVVSNAICQQTGLLPSLQLTYGVAITRIYRHSYLGNNASIADVGFRRCYIRIRRKLRNKDNNVYTSIYSNYIPVTIKVARLQNKYVVSIS